MPDEFALLPLEEFPAALLLTAVAETVGACTGGGGGGDVAGEEEDGAALTTATADDDVDVGCVGEVGVGDLAAARTFGGVALRIGGGGGTAAGLTIVDGLESAGADAVAGVAAADGEGATICEDGGGAGKVGFASGVAVGVGEADLGSGGDANGQPGGLSGESDRRLSICTITAYWA